MIGSGITWWGMTHDNPFWIYAGKEPCRYLLRGYMAAVKLISMSINYDYPDRPDRHLSIGDCCPPTGNCSGHPEGTHAACKAMDTNYYTWGPNNTTQYRPSGEYATEEMRTITPIWNDTCSDLITDIFDWERNYMLMKRTISIFTGGYIHTQNILKDYMVSEAQSKFGSNETDWMSGKVQGDLGCAYNHHTHFHINLGYNPNWDFDIRQWYI